ncbi:MAG: hypothetical protein ACW98F_16400 [Candidatus Hodarchaeales archaeon]|jgi:hypothetical protein
MMSILEMGLIGLSVILAFSTVVCGLWIEFSGEEIKKSDIKFHMIVGFLTVVSTMITIIVLM